MGLGDVVDELSNQDGLSDTGTSKETNLTTSSVRGEQIDDLDAGFEQFGGGRLVNEFWGIGVDGGEHLGLDRTTLIDRLADNVDNTTQTLRADWNTDREAGVLDRLTADKTWRNVNK